MHAGTVVGVWRAGRRKGAPIELEPFGELTDELRARITEVHAALPQEVARRTPGEG